MLGYRRVKLNTRLGMFELCCSRDENLQASHRLDVLQKQRRALSSREGSRLTRRITPQRRKVVDLIARQHRARERRRAARRRASSPLALRRRRATLSLMQGRGKRPLVAFLSFCFFRMLRACPEKVVRLFRAGHAPTYCIGASSYRLDDSIQSERALAKTQARSIGHCP